MTTSLLVPACGLPLYTADDFAEDDGGDGSNGSPSVSGDRPTTAGDDSTGHAEPTTGAGDTSSETGLAPDDPQADDTTTTTTGDDSDDDGGDDETAGTHDPDKPPPDPEVCATKLEPCDHLTDDPLHALGLNCTSAGDEFINKVNAAELSDLEFMAAPVTLGMRPWQVTRAYGTSLDLDTQTPFWGPREGKKLLMISTGLLPPPNDNGAVVVPDGEVYNDVAAGGLWDSNVLPPPMVAANGSASPGGFGQCDGIGDCSNTLPTQWIVGGQEPEDKLWFQFKVTAPPATHGFSFDFAVFSAEFPEYVGTSYNDIFTVWQASEGYTGNITFIDGQPITVTSVWPIKHVGKCPIDDDECVGYDPTLAGTGFLADGGSTGWYRATSGVHPGENFLLSFAIFDMGDSTYDTTALLDNFQWQCDGCEPTVAGSCGVDTQ